MLNIRQGRLPNVKVFSINDDRLMGVKPFAMLFGDLSDLGIDTNLTSIN